MPSEPKPKKFVATSHFTYAHRSYAPGEPVEDRRTIDRLLRYGDRFIEPKRSKPRTPAVDTATPKQPESTKED